MPIPLGILAVAGAGGGAGAGAYELIQTSFGNGSSANITFSSVPQTYKHLQLRMTTRNNYTGSAAEWLRMRFNNVSTTTYQVHNLWGTGSTTASNYYNDRAFFEDIARVAVGGAVSGNYSATIIDILDYASTSKNKTIRVLGGFTDPASSNNYLNLSSGFLNSTNAVTQIDLFSLFSAAAIGYFDTNSRFSLYGIKG
jgi:hypothetical protein